MTRTYILAMVCMAWVPVASGQGRPIDWPAYGGDAQRTGWEKIDSRFTLGNVKDIQLVLKRKLDNQRKGPKSLMPPVVIGNLISYRGFKELAFVAGSSDNLWSIDADLDRIFWHKHFEVAKASGCSGGLTATPALTPPINFAARGPRPGAAPTPPAPPPNPNSPVPAPPAGRGILSAGGFGVARPAFALSSDGKLHLLNTSNGDDIVPPLNFIPAGAQASSLINVDGVIYTATSAGCGAPDALWALDLSSIDAKATPASATVASYKLEGGPAGLAGVAFGNDGSVYVQTSGNKLVVLTPKELKLKQSVALPGGVSRKPASTPVVFAYKGRDLIATAGAEGRIYLLDSQSLGTGAISETLPLSPSGVWGGFASWEDSDGTRWIAAPIWGPVNAEVKSLNASGAAPNGSIVAFRIDEQEGKPMLTPAWISRDMNSPQPPVVTGGIVFALAAGEYGADGRPKSSGHATLIALDGKTGKELYSTGSQVPVPATLTGVTLANGRVFFTTIDSTLWGFGIRLEI